MTSPYLIPDIKMDEGLRLQAYPDPLSGGDPWTVGYGSTSPDIVKGTVWTKAQAEADLEHRVEVLTRRLSESLPWFDGLDPIRQDCLVNMAFNLGLSGLLAFHNTLSMIERGDYNAAAQGMIHSLWARQLPHRAARLARQMASGVHEQ